MTRASARIKKTEEKKEDPKVEMKEVEEANGDEENEEVEEEYEDDDAEGQENEDDGVEEEGGENEEVEGNEGENAENGDEGPKLSEEAKAEAKESNKAISEMDIDKMSIDDILKLKMKLNDGSENFIFSRGPKYEENKWPVNCHLCRLGNLFTEEHIRHHLKGSGHKNKLRFRLPTPKYYNEPFLTSVPKEFPKEKSIKIYPGEFIEEVSEEYQDRILTPEDFAVKLPQDEKLIETLSKEKMHDYNAKLPLLGLCYIYKMMGFRGLTYYCTLCDANLKGEAFKHIVSSDHQFKYIKRHFPTLSNDVHRKLKELRNADDLDILFCERNIFRKLYRKIENIKGQKKITICDDDDFFKHKKRYLLKTRFDEHYDESSILITDQEIDVLVRKCGNYIPFLKPDLISLENPSWGYRLSFRDEKAGRQVSDRDRDNDRDRRDDDYNMRGGGREDGSWYKYFQILDREVDDLNHQYRSYERLPRSHPKCEIEFQRYRNGKKRKDKREFNVPFSTYWKRRLHILYGIDLEKRKQRVKRQLGLRLNARTPSPPRRDNYGGDNMQRGGYGPSGGNLGYGGNDNYGNHGSVPGLRELMNMMNQQSGGGGNYGMDMGGNLNSTVPEPPQIQQNEPLGVISVLRLFTAVENQLGSLGPQAVQLLSRAVIVEKNGQNPNDLMMEKDFYIFFATAREKLKGQYIANTIPTNLMSAAKKIIQDSTTLMEMFEDYCKRTGKSLPDMNMDGHSNMGAAGNNSGSNVMWKGEQSGQLGGNNSYYNSGGNNTGSSNNDNRGGGFGGNQSYGYSTGYSSTSNSNNGFHNTGVGGGNSGYNTSQMMGGGNRWN
ncbi:uncharacterized protein LOC129612686 [Condylostylus longicornis]|uniref:uncharacterized protein LOC129612686 n=1 Tax=Condylostylus longicornis TaxID=2530218 RepID=UPI00244E1A6D|nr:uncharacterized protein LOC129612686 [Condylostylus longicornis]